MFVEDVFPESSRMLLAHSLCVQIVLLESIRYGIAELFVRTANRADIVQKVQHGTMNVLITHLHLPTQERAAIARQTLKYQGLEHPLLTASAMRDILRHPGILLQGRRVRNV